MKTASGRGGLAVHIGALPVRTLGINDQISVDGYGKRFIYAVTASCTNDATADFKKVGAEPNPRSRRLKTKVRKIFDTTFESEF